MHFKGKTCLLWLVYFFNFSGCKINILTEINKVIINEIMTHIIILRSYINKNRTFIKLVSQGNIKISSVEA